MEKRVNFSDTNIEHEAEEESELASDDEKRLYNKFELLDLIEGDDGTLSATDSEGSVNVANDESSGNKQPRQNDKSKNSIKSFGNNKRKLRKRRAKNKNSKKPLNDDVLGGVSDDLRRAVTIQDSGKNRPGESSSYKLLKVDTRNLIPETELKRIFGRGVVKDDKTRPRIHPGSSVQRSRFVASGYFDTKPSNSFSGPKMELDDTINNLRDSGSSDDKANKGGNLCSVFSDRPIYFRFVHDKPYQKAQRLFIEAVHMGHPDFIVQNLSVNTLHAESLVQLSHMIRVSEDYKGASELIERALLVFEKGFHPRFNIATATCRLSYKRPENRTFFITIFKHINCCHRRGLRRTPFEYSKLLLSLEPENDPLMAIQLIDFFAIRSEEYDYLIDLYSQWKQSRNLPNLSFSVALAYFLKSRCTKQSKADNESNLKTADEFLKKALLIFPNFIIPLLDACSAEPDSALKQCSYFDYSVYSNKYKLVSETVDVLVNLYVKRAFSLWKQKHVLSWLERNVAEMVADFANGSLSDGNEHIRHWSGFPKVAPKNLLRHIVLCDLDIKVPPSASSSSFIDIDPYPPTDSIITYETTLNPDEPSNANNVQIEHSVLEELALFLRSLLPSFSLSPTGQSITSPNSGSQRNQTTGDGPPGQRSNNYRSQADGDQSSASNIPAHLRGIISDEYWNRALTHVAGPEGDHDLDRENAESLIMLLEGYRLGLRVREANESQANSQTQSDTPAQANEGEQRNDSRRNADGESELHRRQQPR